MTVVFLDFDGVLVNKESWGRRVDGYSTGHSACVAALNRITATTGARIVVSSSWRTGKGGITRVRQYLKEWGVTAKVIGVTPYLSHQDGKIWREVERGHEIADYLKRHPAIERYVILDDDADMVNLAHRHIMTEFNVGLTEADADRAIEMLKEE